MRIPLFHLIRALTLLLSTRLGLASAEGADWQIFRVEGRDYVSVENIAQFYGLAPPKSAPNGANPAFNGLSPANASALTALHAALPGVPPPLSVQLVAGTKRLVLTGNTREAMINGAKQWLSFACQELNGQLLVSRIDLAKVIEPRLRPEHIAGVRPVRTVVLDPGHGGHDLGAGTKLGYEKDFALDVSLRARQVLQARGYQVAMTRSSDVFIPLESRPQLAQSFPDSIFVSIHFNATSTNAEARGFEIFSMAPRGAPATNDPILSSSAMREDPGNGFDMLSGALAGAVYHSLLGHLPMADRGLKQARFAVLRRCTVPAVLIECGFVSNASDLEQIQLGQWRNRVAEAIADGIDQYQQLAIHKQAPKLVADYRSAAAGNLVPTATPSPSEPQSESLSNPGIPQN